MGRIRFISERDDEGVPILQFVNGMIGNVVITRESPGAMPDDYQPTLDDVQNKPNIPAI